MEAIETLNLSKALKKEKLLMGLHLA